MLKTYCDKSPNIAKDAFIAEDAIVVGDVLIKNGASVFYHSVIRGDNAQIVIDEDSNIQDNCVIHVNPKGQCYIGKRVSVGHAACIHGAYIEDDVLIGMHATILNNVHIGKHCIIGAGALIKENSVIESGSLVVGCPGIVVKRISDKQKQEIHDNALHYKKLAKNHRIGRIL